MSCVDSALALARGMTFKPVIGCLL